MRGKEVVRRIDSVYQDQQDNQDIESVNSLYSCGEGRGEGEVCCCKVKVLQNTVIRANDLLTVRRTKLCNLLLKPHSELSREDHKCSALKELLSMVSTLSMLLI